MRQVVFSDRARADIECLDAASRLRIGSAIERLTRLNTGDVKKLKGIDPPEYRLRAGDWRVRFSRPDAGTLLINRIQHRRDVCR